MAIKKIEIQDHQGNIYHPHTDAKVVFTSDGKTVEESIESLKSNVSNGKTVLATAIGAPLASTDTFAQMSSKVDTLTNTFKNNLVAKGVEVAPGSKMSNLIDNVLDIDECVKILPSENYLMDKGFMGTSLKEIKSTTYVEAFKTKIFFKGSIRLYMKIENSSGVDSGCGTVRVSILRNNSNIFSKDILTNKTQPYYISFDLSDLLPLDYIVVGAFVPHFNYSIFCYPFDLKGDII